MLNSRVRSAQSYATDASGIGGSLKSRRALPMLFALIVFRPRSAVSSKILIRASWRPKRTWKKCL